MTRYVETFTPEPKNDAGMVATFGGFGVGRGVGRGVNEVRCGSGASEPIG